MNVLVEQPRPKRHWGIALILSNSTLYATFLVSIALHVALMYGVPSVVIFSEGGWAKGDAEPIEVALLSPQESANLPDVAAAESNQFAVDVPSPLLEGERAALEDAPAPFADEDAVTLLSRETQAPELALPDAPLPERAPPALDLAAPERLTRLLAKPLPDEREFLRPQLAAPQKLDAAAERKALPPSRIEETQTAFPSDHPPTFGMPKENETEQTGFGIYAGPRYDKLKAQEDAQLAQPKKPERLAESDAVTAPAFSPEQQIEGPVKGRSVVYRPALPSASIKINLELRFRFWVMPDGSIGEVIPIKRGNADLERIAISYLKQWRFEPLPLNVPQQQMWGTIPIKFIAQ